MQCIKDCILKCVDMYLQCTCSVQKNVLSICRDKPVVYLPCTVETFVWCRDVPVYKRLPMYFLDALASLVLMIETHSLTHSEIGN